MKKLCCFFLLLFLFQSCQEDSGGENKKSDLQKKKIEGRQLELQKQAKEFYRKIQSIQNEIDEVTVNDTTTMREKQKNIKRNRQRLEISIFKQDSIKKEKENLIKKKRSLKSELNNKIWIKKLNEIIDEKNRIIKQLLNLKKMIIKSKSSYSLADMRYVQETLKNTYKDYFKELQEPLPQLIEPKDGKFESESDRILSIIDQIKESIENEKKEAIKNSEKDKEKIQNKLKKIIQDLEEIENEITEYKNIQQLLEEKIKQDNQEIKNIHTKLEKFRQDKQQELNKYIIKWRDCHTELIRLLYGEVKFHTPELEEKYSEILKLEDQILNLCQQGKFRAAQALIDSILSQWNEYIQLIDTANECFNKFYRKLFNGIPLLTYYPLGERKFFSQKEEVQDYLSVFNDLLVILKEYLKNYPNTTIYIDGHADRLEYSSNVYKNVKLSKDRAHSIADKIKNSRVLKPQTSLIIDWYSKHLNRPVISRHLVEKDSGGVFDRRVEIRIVRNFLNNEPIPINIKKYLKFRDSLKIQVDGQNKYFKHKEGYWEDFDYSRYNSAPEIELCYQGNSYKTLQKNDYFKNLVSQKDSTDISPECRIKDIRKFELGSLLKTVIVIDGQVYRLHIFEQGADEISKVKNENFRRYLRSLE